MIERNASITQRAQVDMGPAEIICELDGKYQRTVTGVGVRVFLDGEVIWETREYPLFISSTFGFPPKPFYKKRIERNIKKAEKLAQKLNSQSYS